jgi:hypothetical protein
MLYAPVDLIAVVIMHHQPLVDATTAMPFFDADVEILV